jgi:hypothetical protein
VQLAFLSSLELLMDRLAKKAGALELAAATNASPRRKLTLTPKRRAQLKLQSQYMGYMRPLKPQQKRWSRRRRKIADIRPGG